LNLLSKIQYLTILCLIGYGFSSAVSMVWAAATPTAAQENTAESTVNPSRVGESLIAPTQQAGYSTKTPSIETPPEPQPLIEGAEKIKLTLNKVIINGATIYSSNELQSIFTPYNHKEITLAKLLILVDSITNKYRNDGYILSKAYLPPQEIKEGVVQVNVIEGYIAKIEVTGKPQWVDPIVLKYGKRVRNIIPLKMSDLEHYLLLMNDLPGTDVKSVLIPSKTQIGAADLNLVTTFKVIQGSIAYDNFSSRYLGPREVTLGAQLNSLFSSGDSNLLRGIVSTNTREMKYFQFTHDQPAGNSGARINFGGYYTQTAPGSSLQSLDVVGRSKYAYIGANYPVIRSRTKNVTLLGSFNYSNTKSTLLAAPFYNDRVRYLNLFGQFENADSWRGINLVGLGVQKGFDILNASSHGDLSRPDGHANFTLFNANIMRLQGIVNHLSIWVAGQGQTALVPLLSGQQFGFGGPDYGRSYDPSEIVGDRGLAGKFELRVDTNPEWRLLKSTQFYIFYDIGAVWNIDTTNQAAKISASSAGYGVRFTILKNVNGNLYMAKPLTKTIASLVAVGQTGWGPRGFFSINLSF